MGSFGSRLKSEREKKNISLDQVAVSTKISTRMLRALEDEKFELLPGGIFNKGFVRAYARQLGLNEEEAVADYLAAAGGPVQLQPEGVELRAMAEQKEKELKRQASLSRDFPWGWTAAILLIGAAGLSVWGFYSRTGTTGNATSVAPAAQPISRVPPTHQGTAHYQPSVATDSVSQANQPRTEGSSFNLVIKAEQDSWVSITADGSAVFTGTLVAPEERSVAAQSSVVVRAGNIGGLDILFNGKRIMPQGDYGEVKTLTFNSDGLQREPTPKTGAQ